MQKFTLELLFQIIGIGSASGLVYKDHSAFIIGDNSGYLYEYNLENKDLKRHALIQNPAENIAKKDKPDFEAITHFGNDFYIFGSGSTEKRNTMVQINATTKEIIATTDLTNLYLVMQSFGKIKPEDFNIEGAIYNGENWFLLNRGNGSAYKNIVFTIQGKNLTNEFNILSNEFTLPKIKGVRSSFTDAVLVDNKIYFLATAEDTNSTYDDGEVSGSLIGRIDIDTMEIDFTHKISDTHKFEGLSLYKSTDDKLEFLLCDDNDTEELKANIYKLTLDK
ncbi:hypothetical protein [Flavobacterium sp. GT3R68]|uniref:DUF6929 family protein n=1 Tax=Flavobacterium sp. GT3R68 TaxID=2594437 RepID=UPI000F89B3C3|nr:hypothetical protein [Flavobacterium sp. GT3R68]RTY93437.1 hypothetical protein EKL32_16435 [Flavobacterium sp. GSN2]TRW92390.1 hypothetical protein FNW07_05105 [Flavobacterium sp. GT3R68]